jgi:tRNA-binding protein
MADFTDFTDFMKLDIRVGEIINAEVFEKAKKPAYKLWVDFGSEIGVKKTSAQITECYKIEQLIGKQVLGVVNFPPKQVANFISEVLVLGVYAEQGVVLIQPDQKVNKGDKLG